MAPNIAIDITPAISNAFVLTPRFFLVSIVFILHLTSAFRAENLISPTSSGFADSLLFSSHYLPEAAEFEPSNGASITARLFPLTT